MGKKIKEIQPEIIIIGCGRSGTGFAAQALTANNIKVGHERIKENGISSWYLTPKPEKNKPYILGPNYSVVSEHFKNPKIYHQVRHPIKSISSLITHDKGAWTYISHFTPNLKWNEKQPLMAMKHWLHWNLLAEENADITYRVDDFFKVFNLDEQSYPSKKYNTRHHFNYNEEMLFNTDKHLWNDIKELAIRYGFLF